MNETELEILKQQIYRLVQQNNVAGVRDFFKENPALINSFKYEEIGYGEQLSLLHLACHYNDLPMVKLLISLGADVDALDWHSHKPIYYTISINGHLEILKLLLQHMKEINYGDILFAKYEDRITVTEILLNAGARIGTERLFKRAIIDGNEELVDLLINSLKNEMSIEHPSLSQLNIFLYHATCHSLTDTWRKNSYSTVEKLIAAGVNISAKSKCGMTPLSNAIHFIDNDLIQLLLLNGAQVSNALGIPDLLEAAKNCNLKTIELLTANATIEDLQQLDFNGASILHYACLNEHEDVLPYFLNKGLNFVSKDKDQNNTLHSAASQGKVYDYTDNNSNGSMEQRCKNIELLLKTKKYKFFKEGEDRQCHVERSETSPGI